MPETVVTGEQKRTPPPEVVLGSKVLSSEPDAGSKDATLPEQSEVSAQEAQQVDVPKQEAAIAGEPAVEAKSEQDINDELQEIYRQDAVAGGSLADDTKKPSPEEIASEQSMTPHQRAELLAYKTEQKLERERNALREEIELIRTHPGMPEQDKARLPERLARLEEIDAAMARLDRQKSRFNKQAEPVGAATPKEKPTDVSQEYVDKQSDLERRLQESGRRLRIDLAEITLRGVERDQEALQDKIDNTLPFMRAERARLVSEMEELQELRLLPELRTMQEAFGDPAELDERDRARYESVLANKSIIEQLVAERAVRNLQDTANETSANVEKTLTGDVWEMRNRANGLFSGPTELTEREQSRAQAIIARAKELRQRISVTVRVELTPEDRKDKIEQLLEEMKVAEQEANLEKARTALRLQREQSKSTLERMGGWAHEKSMAIAGEWNKIPLKYRTALSLSLMAASWGAPGLLGAMGGAAYAASTMEVINKVVLAKRVVGAFATYAFLEKGLKGIQENDRGVGKGQELSWKDTAFRRVTAGTAAFLVGSGLGADGVKYIAKGVGSVAHSVMDWFGNSDAGKVSADAVKDVARGLGLGQGGSGYMAGNPLGALSQHNIDAAQAAAKSVGAGAGAAQEHVSGAVSGASKIVAEAPPLEKPLPVELPTPAVPQEVIPPMPPLPPAPDVVAELAAKSAAKAAEVVVSTITPESIADHAVHGGEDVWEVLRKDVIEYAHANKLPLPTPRGINNIIGNILAQRDPSHIDAGHMGGWFQRAQEHFGLSSDTVHDAGSQAAQHGADVGTVADSAPSVPVGAPVVEHPAVEVPHDVSHPDVAHVDTTPAEAAPETAHITEAVPHVAPVPEAPPVFTTSGAMLEDLAKSGVKHFHEVPKELLGKSITEQVNYLLDRDMSWMDQKGIFGGLTKWHESALWMDMKETAADHMMKGKSLAPITSPFNVMARYLTELSKQVPMVPGEKVAAYLERAIGTLRSNR